MNGEEIEVETRSAAAAGCSVKFLHFLLWSALISLNVRQQAAGWNRGCLSTTSKHDILSEASSPSSCSMLNTHWIAIEHRMSYDLSLEFLHAAFLAGRGTTSCLIRTSVVRSSPIEFSMSVLRVSLWRFQLWNCACLPAYLPTCHCFCYTHKNPLSILFILSCWKEINQFPRWLVELIESTSF